jgi:hypothetical protein
LVRANDYAYDISILSESMYLRVFVNDAEVLKTSDLKNISSTFGLKKYLKDGVNQIVLDVAPFNIDKRNYEFHNDVKLEFFISSYRLDGIRKLDESQAFVVSSSFEKGLMENEVFGVISDKNVSYEVGNVKFLGFEDQGEIDIEYTSNSKSTGKRFKVEFFVEDESLVSPPWLDAVPVDDYGKISGKVWSKYKDVWSLFDGNDFDGYVEELGLVLDRVAYVTGYKNRYKVADEVFPNQMLVLDGKSLVSLDSWKAFYPDLIVSLSPDKKLIRIYPNPIRFYDENGNDNSAMSYYMCLMPSGEVKVCYQKDNGQ